MRNLSFIITKSKDTWGGPRDPTGGMCSGSRGSCPYNSWLSSLIIPILTLYSAYCRLVVYVGEVPGSFVVAYFGSGDCTRSFFASGSAESSSGCLVVAMVALPVLSLCCLYVAIILKFCDILWNSLSHRSESSKLPFTMMIRLWYGEARSSQWAAPMMMVDWV
jgi:hypothetical protein